VDGSKYVIWHPASIGRMLKTDACISARFTRKMLAHFKIHFTMTGSNYLSGFVWAYEVWAYEVCLAKCMHTSKVTHTKDYYDAIGESGGGWALGKSVDI